jgi:hypothetical protein
VEKAIGQGTPLKTGNELNNAKLPIKRSMGGEHGDGPLLDAWRIGHGSVCTQAHPDLLRTIRGNG